jgi:serine/threonine-protein kinase
MEFLEGEDLSSLIARTGPLPIAQTVDLMLPVLAAIAVAHDEGVIHRDLKPENIFLTRTRFSGLEPKVLDFGISKLTSSGGGNTLALTGTGASMGTPYYIAPEQVRSAAGVDARSDQYALGAILYECVTGRRAHQGETIYEVIRSVGEGSFPPPRALRPDTPAEIDEAILRAMALDPARRFPSVRALGRTLMRFASPAVRAQWAPAMEGDDPNAVPSSQRKTQAQAAQSPTSQSQPGGTVVFATPAPGQAGPAGSRSPSNTTFGSSAAQIALPARNRSGWLAGGLAVLGAAAVVAYVVTSPSAHHPRAPEAQRPTENVQETSAAAGLRKPPGRYRVQVAAEPRAAVFELDGTRLGTGRIDEELPLDGTQHTLVVSATGFVPARLSFRDRAPAEAVTLQPIPSAPKPVEPTAAARPSRPAPHTHGGAHQQAHTPTTSARPSGPARTENNAAIIDD